jgi:hypothetical protein
MIEFQNPWPLHSSRPSKSKPVQIGGLLGNRDAQHLSSRELEPVTRSSELTQPSRLEILKSDRFRSSTKTERVARSIISLELSRTIEVSRQILQLQDDWDTEGSPSYSEATLARATTFLLSNAVRYWRDHQTWVLAPRILPGPDGNIDLHWKTPQRELLISIPANPAEHAAYYGDDREDGTENAIRGKGLDTSAYNEWIIAWLMR